MSRTLAVFTTVAILLAAGATTSLASAISATARTVHANGSPAGKVYVQIWYYNINAQIIHSNTHRSDANGDYGDLIDLTGVTHVAVRPGTGPTYTKVPNSNGVVNFGRIYITPCDDCPNIEDGSGP